MQNITTPIHDLCRMLEAEIQGFETKAKSAKGSDTKKYKALAQRTRDFLAQLQVAGLLEYCSPALILLSPDMAARFHADAVNSGRGPGQAFRDSANMFLQDIANVEQEKFGGIFFSQMIAEYLRRVNWGYLGEHIENLAGAHTPAEEMPTAVGCLDCGIESQVAIGRNNETNMFYCVCALCSKRGPEQATKPQAIIAWNKQESERPKKDEKVLSPFVSTETKPVELSERDDHLSRASLVAAGYDVPLYVLNTWDDDRIVSAIQYASEAGEGTMAEPVFLRVYRSETVAPGHSDPDADLRALLKRCGHSVPLDKLKKWSPDQKIAAATWANAWLWQTEDEIVNVDVPEKPEYVARWNS